MWIDRYMIACAVVFISKIDVDNGCVCGLLQCTDMMDDAILSCPEDINRGGIHS